MTRAEIDKILDAQEDIHFLLSIIDSLSDGQCTLYELHTADLQQLTDIRTEWENQKDRDDGSVNN